MIERGDILQAGNRNWEAGFHYIIFYAGKDLRQFLGAIITTSEKFDENIKMNSIHFEKKDYDQKVYKVQYNKSYLVPAKLVKLESWGPFTKVGKLTKEGVTFVESNIDNLGEVTWDEYLEQRKG